MLNICPAFEVLGLFVIRQILRCFVFKKMSSYESTQAHSWKYSFTIATDVAGISKIRRPSTTRSTLGNFELNPHPAMSKMNSGALLIIRPIIIYYYLFLLLLLLIVINYYCCFSSSVLYSITLWTFCDVAYNLEC